MTMLARLHAASETTWPPGARHRVGSVTVREGRGAGNRVSAATAEAGWTEDDVAAAEQAMGVLGQPALFMIRDGERALDDWLARRGYRMADAAVFYVMSLEPRAAPDPMTAFPHWPPLAIVRSIWAGHRIDAARQAVMDRVEGPRKALLGRSQDRPSGAAFAAIGGGDAFLHALVVPEHRRRHGAGAQIVRMAAAWATGLGARRLGLSVAADNAPARALYAFLGMEAVGQYHYRVK